MTGSKPTTFLAQHDWETWIESLPTAWRQAAYRGRAYARKELARQATNDTEARHHHDRIGHYEARAEAMDS